MGQRRNRNWWGRTQGGTEKLNCQTSKVESDYYTGLPPLHHPSPQMGPLKHPEIPSPFPPHQWDEVFRKKPSVIRNLQSSPSPHSQCLSSYGLLGMGSKLKGCHLPPLSHTWSIPSFPRHHQKPDTHTHTHTHTHTRTHTIFLQLADTLVTDIWLFWPLQRGPSLLFDPCTND